jgi:multisubunit Na+/H+ antiporter MnhB subunit
MVNNVNKITIKIKRQLHSGSNKLNSSDLYIIVWGAITILVVFMLFYYTINKSNGILKTLITILVCIIIIWIVASWFYNYFYRNSISFFFCSTNYLLLFSSFIIL